MYESIIVPLDDSVTSHHALATAVIVARTWTVPIQLVSVESPGIESSEAMFWMLRALEDVDAPALPPVVLESNDVAEALRSFVDEHAPALLCMSTHGRSAIGSVVVGSVTADVLAIAEAPVLLVGPHSVPAFDVRDIVLGVEPRSVGEVEVAAAVEWARHAGARVHLVSVVTDAAAVLVGEDEVRAELADLAARCRAAGASTSWRVVDGANAAGALLEAANVAGAGLVVVGTRATRGLARLVLGSVAQDVLRRATCPVLVVPPRARLANLATSA